MEKVANPWCFQGCYNLLETGGTLGHAQFLFHMKIFHHVMLQVLNDFHTILPNQIKCYAKFSGLYGVAK